jgi:acyl carrier protein
MSVETAPNPTDPAMIERLLAIISKEGMVAPEKLSLDATLNTLGVASVDVVVILLAIEEEFGVYIPVNNELSEIKTVGDLVHELAKHIAANSAKI